MKGRIGTYPDIVLDENYSIAYRRNIALDQSGGKKGAGVIALSIIFIINSVKIVGAVAIKIDQVSTRCVRTGATLRYVGARTGRGGLTTSVR